MSMTLSDGLTSPLLVTTACRPSGETATLSGSVLTWRCLPAGLSRQPFGRSVEPSPIAPGDALSGGGTNCARTSAVVATATSNAADQRIPRVVEFETTV